MNERWLIDTDVLIDYLRANSEAIDYLENINSRKRLSRGKLLEQIGICLVEFVRLSA